MSEDDRARWDARWAQRDLDAARAAPAGLLVRSAAYLPWAGRALDVAAGAGRNALWLAARGLDVTAVDISDAGLALCRRAAAGAGLAVATEVRDLEDEPLPAGPWDVIVCHHYLQRSLFPAFAAALAPGGVLVFSQPTVRNLERHSRPSRRFLLHEGELPGLVTAAGLTIAWQREDWTEDARHESEVVARRER